MKNDIKKTLFEKSLVWVMNKKVYLFSILASIVFMNVILYKVMPFFEKRKPNISLLAHKSYKEWKKSAFKDEKKLEKLKAYLKKDISVKSNYESLILQNLLINNKFSKKDLKIANGMLKKVKEDLPLYYDYSQITILINKNKLKEALEQSKALKNKMLSDLNFLKEGTLPGGAVLYSFNLFRIAILEAKLCNFKEETEAWEELERYLNLNSFESINEKIKMASDTVQELFKENNISLVDYIKYRKNQLKA